MGALLFLLIVAGADLASELEAEMREERLSEHLKGPLLGCVASEDEIAALPADAIRYRTLARADFLAPEGMAPDDSVSDPRELGGVHLDVELSCATRVEVEDADGGRFEARIASLRYFALLFRERCWWNPRLDLDEARTLLHQQGHFALFELTARRLEAEAGATRAALRGRGDDAQAAADDLQRQWGQHMLRAIRDLRERAERYDRDTEHGRDAEAQRDWSDRLAAELADEAR